jgi:hydroxymethylbilane synthase
MPQQILRIATRKSLLAMWQANHIRDLLLMHWPSLKIELVPMVTSGDKFLSHPLSMASGKNLFVKELEEAMLENKADIAVHSMKDVPATLPDGLAITAICTRHNPLDVLVSPSYTSLANLPQGAVVGTVSLRRQSQLLAIRPDLHIKPLRGNLQTRLAKVQSNDYDAIILAAAGLERLALNHHISEVLPADIMLPACGQGALGIECRTNDEVFQRLITPINDQSSAMCVKVERHVNAQLGGNCHVPVAVFCTLTDNSKLVLRAKVLSADGKVIISNQQTGHPTDAMELATHCANGLLADGATDLLMAGSS